MTKNRVSGLFALAFGMLALAGVATGQMTLPPPAEPVTPPEYVPAPPPPPEPIRIQPQPVEARPVAQPLPNLPWKAWEVDAQGMAVPLSEPLDYAAFNRNPMVDDLTRDRVRDYLKERKATYERLVIEHVDLMGQLEDGLLEKVDTRSRDTMSPAIMAVRPIAPPQGPKSLGDEMRARGLLTPQQAEFQSKIKNEYLKRAVELPPADAPAEVKTEHNLKSMLAIYKRNFDEPRMVYRDLLIEAGALLASGKASLKLDGAAAKLMDGLKSASGPGGTLEAMKKLFAEMSVEQRQDLLRQTIAARK